MTRVYVSTTDTAKLIRADLKATFPAIKFSVRSNSYANGSSIDVRWTDGPTGETVNAAIRKYEGASFDGMTDMKSYVDHTDEQGNQIHYGADYVFCRRDYSEGFLRQMMAHVTAYWYWNEDPQYEIIPATKWSSAYVRTNNRNARCGDQWANDWFHRQCWHTSAEQLQEMIANAG
jgi:hypothetical protein